jgi:MFS transporter, BCD family, chlorophyll transporter
MNRTRDGSLSWIGIIRLGLVQTALGAIVVLTTSTLNRVMVIELALPAAVPGLLVAWHYALQVLRPRWGYGSDRGGRRTPWILGGMATLAAGGALAAVATAAYTVAPLAAALMAVTAFTLIGIGVGSSGTNLLVLLAEETSQARRPAAATLVWLMMIAGFVVTTVTAGHFLDPYSPTQLVKVVGAVSVIAMLLTVVAIAGIESGRRTDTQASEDTPVAFRAALTTVWQEPKARRFTIFIFVSMLAYSAQDLILEPFAGAVFGMTPGQSTKLGGVQHGGVFVGMILVPLCLALIGQRDEAMLQRVIVGGCIASGLALMVIAAGAPQGVAFPLKPAVFTLGVANGVFAVAAIALMMTMAVDGTGKRDGTRMGLWGAAQAVAFGLGGLAGAVGVDIARMLTPDTVAAYSAVFMGEGIVFIGAAMLAAWIARQDRVAEQRSAPPLGPTTLLPGE